MKKIRCAIYTRKSSEDGLEQEFNSLDAQREACAAYVQSQKAEGWELLPEEYDDGGLSGGSLERPALQRLLSAIDKGTVDQVIVYKIDRLTRSLADFARIVDRLDAAEASFVSVTQSFNTATSMGRLTLNMLLSFAQFEREVAAERIRDKIGASKQKGLWMGGSIPLGYAPDGRSLKIAEPDADVIRTIYNLYLKHRNPRMVKRELDALGLKTPVRTLCSGRVKGGATFGYKHVHNILTNPVYAGRIRHHAKVYPGQHPPLIIPEIWDSIQEELRSDFSKARTSTKRNRGETRHIIGDAPAEIDETLLRNIGRAHRYFDLVRSGRTFNEIADAEGVSKRRIQHLIELAFLAPDVIRSVWEGRQPAGMTSGWLQRHAFSPVWSEQRAQFASL